MTSPQAGTCIEEEGEFCYQGIKFSIVFFAGSARHFYAKPEKAIPIIRCFQNDLRNPTPYNRSVLDDLTWPTETVTDKSGKYAILTKRSTVWDSTQSWRFKYITVPFRDTFRKTCLDRSSWS
jgi:hypothetical protein